MKVQVAVCGCVLAVALLAPGCTRYVSRGVSSDGKVVQPIFPDDRFLGPDGGSYPDPAALARLGPGMSKGQVLGLLGPPHYREGFAAREWDYLFLFRTAKEDRSCRYKVVFDAQYRAQALLWKPESCAAWVKTQAVAAGPEADKPKAIAAKSSPTDHHPATDPPRPSHSH